MASPSEKLRAAIERAREGDGGRQIGLRTFESQVGLKPWSLRGIAGRRKQAPSVDKAEEICRALGLEFYIGEPRGVPRGKSPHPPEPDQATDAPPVWHVDDEELWALIGAFADEWKAADAAGREKLEIRFAAQFPELVRGSK